MSFDLDLTSRFRANLQRTKLKDRDDDGDEEDGDHLTISIPDRRVLSVIARSLLLVLTIAAFPWIGSIFEPASASGSHQPHSTDPRMLPLLLRDLASSGLIRTGYRAAMVCTADRRSVRVMEENGAELVPVTALRRWGPGTLDFVFVPGTGFGSLERIGRALRVGGVAAVLLGGGPRRGPFRAPPNFKIVYVRHLGATVVAMRKTGSSGGFPAARV